MTTVVITTEFIKLQDLLKFENLVETGGIAKQIIQDGEVLAKPTQCKDFTQQTHVLMLLDQS